MANEKYAVAPQDRVGLPPVESPSALGEPGSPSCAVCGGAEFEQAFGQLWRCRKCDHVQYFVARSVATSLYTDHYFNGGEYAAYMAQEDVLRKSMRRHLAQMSSYGPLRGTLLEIGCAYGLFADEARRYFEKIVGVDICAGPVAFGRKRFGLDLRCEDATLVPPPPGAFDAVCMWDTIEHVPNPAEFVSAARHSLAPGGRFYLTTGDIGSLNARLRRGRWRQIHPPSHLQYFSQRTMARLLERCGLEVLGIDTASYYHTLFNVLSVLRLRGGVPGKLANAALRSVGEGLSRRMGTWVNLGDIMFVAARVA